VKFGRSYLTPSGFALGLKIAKEGSFDVILLYLETIVLGIKL